MLNWMVWNRNVLDIAYILTLNWIVRNRTVLTFILAFKLRTYEMFWYLIVWTKTILILNWIVWIRTIWLNWIDWNRNIFDN